MFLAPTTFTIRENRHRGFVVGAVNTFDPEGQSVTYAITAGNTDSAFAINASTGEITVNNSAALDFETTPQFVLSVQAVDDGSPANSRTQAITINLTNVNGASVPEEPQSEPIVTTSAGTSGEQVMLNQSPAIATTRRTPPSTVGPVLYSFTLYEPLAATPAGKERAGKEEVWPLRATSPRRVKGELASMDLGMAESVPFWKGMFRNE